MFTLINPFNRHADPIPSNRPVYFDRNAELVEFTKLDIDGRLGFSWSGAHPLTPHITSFVLVETRNLSLEVTHLFYVGAKHRDETIRLYDRQANMDVIGYSADKAAAIVGAGLVRFLLRARNPAKVPGVIQQISTGQTSPWPEVFQDLRLGLIKQQLDRYQIPVKAYKANPTQYNGIKNAPPSV